METATASPLLLELLRDYQTEDSPPCRANQRQGKTPAIENAPKPLDASILAPEARGPPRHVTPLAQETRATLPTHEAAYHLNLACQTMRIYACKESGPLRPLRISGRLHWRTDDLRRLLLGAAA